MLSVALGLKMTVLVSYAIARFFFVATNHLDHYGYAVDWGHCLC